jgi:hypothetical protein
VNDPASYNSTLVEMLKDAGAVLYVKTNVPTAMMIAETVNNVFGRTVNPLNRKLTSGGSSGGESALIAFGGSPLGIGTDIGTLPYSKVGKCWYTDSNQVDLSEFLQHAQVYSHFGLHSVVSRLWAQEAGWQVKKQFRV